MKADVIKLATALMSGNVPKLKRVGLRDRQFEEVSDDDVDFEFESPSQFFGSHVNLIPLQSAVAGPRLFYGARFYNQAMPLVNAEAPLVQARADNQAEGEDTSFDDVFGRYAGAVRADAGGRIVKVTPDEIELVDERGETKRIGLYNRFPFNRKTQLHNTALVKPGDTVSPGQILAKSNYTDDKGTLAMGVNARVGVVPYFGRSMDDAIVISDAFARRLTSNHLYGHDLDYKRGVKGGKAHFIGIFPQQFTTDQLKKVDDDGVVKPGEELQPGDPIILATKPRVITSASAQLGLLSKHMRNARQNAMVTWDKDTVGRVVDVEKLRSGVKVNIETDMPAKEGDKIVFRSGQKGIISHIIPDEHMPRTADGNPLEVLLNPLGVPSRVNNSIIYELLLGKAAQRMGKPMKLPSFNQPGEKWFDIVSRALNAAGVNDTEEVFDPKANRKLENPITVGVGHVLKLHHTSECFDDQTEVLTQSGWKKWPDVTMADQLATSDVLGHSLFFEKPLHLMAYDYVGKLCAFSGRYVDYAVTPNHNLWVKTYYGTRTFGLHQASKIHGRRFKIKQFGFEVLDPGSQSRFVIGARSFDWDDFCEFVGWWVTEGCVMSTGSGVMIYQSQSANPVKSQRIQALLDRMQLKWSPYLTEGQHMGFAVNEKFMADYFSDFGKTCQHKRVPREIVTGSLSGIRRTLEAMLLGDGSHVSTPTGPSVALCSTSQGLADDFQEMCIRTGSGSIVRSDSRAWAKYQENPHYLTAYRASYTETRNNTQVDGDRAEESFSMPDYNGKVYCAEMRTGLLYVRRNGKPMLTGNSKISARGQGAYTADQQPLHGGSEAGKSKRLSGLETHSLLSSGAYNMLREGATLRGQRNDEYWRMLRQGHEPRPPGSPFVWDKFKTLLMGAGYQAKNLGEGRIRLQFWTDRDLDDRAPIEVKTGDLIDLGKMQPVKGGLFDDALTGSGSWGFIQLPHPVPNPAAEDVIRKLLGLTEKQFRSIMAGEEELPEHLRFSKPT